MASHQHCDRWWWWYREEMHKIADAKMGEAVVQQIFQNQQQQHLIKELSDKVDRRTQFQNQQNTGRTQFQMI